MVLKWVFVCFFSIFYEFKLIVVDDMHLNRYFFIFLSSNFRYYGLEVFQFEEYGIQNDILVF